MKESQHSFNDLDSRDAFCSTICSTNNLSGSPGRNFLKNGRSAWRQLRVPIRSLVDEI